MQTAATALRRTSSPHLATAASGTQATDAAAATDQRGSFGDLSKLIDAAQSNDTAGIRLPPKTARTIFRARSAGVASAHVGSHHHHHHQS
jgi:hypothetical protein